MKTDSSYTPLQRFWKILKPDRREISHIYAYSIFSGLVNLSLPLGIQSIINLIQGGQVSTSWIVLVVIVILGVGLTGFLQIMQLRITENLQQNIFTRAAFEFAFRIPRIRMEALYRHYGPELMNRFFDVISVQKGLAKILVDFSAASLQIIFGLILLCFYHPFFIVFSLALIILVYAIFRFTARRGLETSLEESKYKYKVAHWLEELARTNMSFKLAGETTLPLDKTDEQVTSYVKARESHFKILLRQFSLMVLFKVLVATGLLLMGGILVMNQLMNIGQFVAAEIIILLVMTSVEKLILSLESIYDVLTSLEKVGQVTDLELDRCDGHDIRGTERNAAGMSLELEDVEFAFPDQQDKVLRGVSLQIKSGEHIALRGPNGSGKSTLLQLISGLYEPLHGRVVYDGLPHGNLHPATLRAVTGDSLSQQQIFKGTFSENICMGRPEIPFERVQEVVAKIGLAGFVKGLTKGYETVLDPEGRKLPRSIIQKILIARSLVHRPRLVVLEEFLEHIDERERKSIVDYICDPSNGWTLVATADDSYFMSRVDRVLTMNNGVIEY
jgi:ABC-type bacteriocin/lantibiotic exporter with double-glycine peptidase domain